MVGDTIGFCRQAEFLGPIRADHPLALLEWLKDEIYRVCDNVTPWCSSSWTPRSGSRRGGPPPRLDPLVPIGLAAALRATYPGGAMVIIGHDATGRAVEIESISAIDGIDWTLNDEGEYVYSFTFAGAQDPAVIRGPALGAAGRELIDELQADGDYDECWVDA